MTEFSIRNLITNHTSLHCISSYSSFPSMFIPTPKTAFMLDQKSESERENIAAKKPCLISNPTTVDGTRQGWIGRSADDGSPIDKHRDKHPFQRSTQEKWIGLHRPQILPTFGQSLEIEPRWLRGLHLHRIAPAQDDRV